MKIVDSIEQTLNGGYLGLYGEVVDCDCYGIRDLDFVPDIVFDIGANVGVFTRFARSLFPNAEIIAVEPHLENIIHFKKFTSSPRIELLEAALGTGEVYHCDGAANGAHETYLSSGLGYPGLISGGRYSHSTVPSLTLPQIIRPRWTPGMKALLKIDCEGAENSLWQDFDAMLMIRQMDYFAIELHYYGCQGEDVVWVRQVTDEALGSLQLTHWCVKNGVYFTARKKELCQND